MTNPQIYLYAPSGNLLSKIEMDRAVARLEQAGFRLALDPGLLNNYQRFAGTDAQRSQAVARAATSGAAVVMQVRGGYGLSRILPRLDYQQLQQAFAQQQWLGYSDFSVLQAAAYSQVGATSWAGAMLVADFATEKEPSQQQYALLQALVERRWHGAAWQVAADTAVNVPTSFSASGQIWGGNLTVLTHLIGTAYFPDISNGILYFEDIGEHPYKVERMLNQWLYSGILAKQQALLMGQFSDYQLASNDNGYNLAETFKYLQSKLEIPIITDLPFGHLSREAYLPFGQTVHLSLNHGAVQLEQH